MLFSTADLHSLLRDEDFDFNFRGKRIKPAAYFAPTDEHELIMAGRNILTRSPDHCWVLDGADPLLEEAANLAKTLDPGFQAPSDPRDLCRALSLHWEPDIVLMSPTVDGMFMARAAAVCFPSGWNPEDVKGRLMHEIHEPVPGLNEALAKKIYTLFNGLEGGTAWWRANWSFSVTPELNLRATRGLTRIDNHPDKDIYFRAESQIIYKLPKTGGILFGIRIFRRLVSELAQDPVIAKNFIRLMKTMPPEMLGYKGITKSVERILSVVPRT